VRAERKRLWGSTEGVEAAQKEAREIHAAISKLADEIKKSSSDLKLLVGSNHDSTVLTNGRVSVVIYFRLTYGNTLENSFFVIREMNGRVLLPQERGHYMVLTEPKELSSHKFDPDITSSNVWCWRSQSDPKMYYTSGDMTDYCIQTFLNLIDRADRGDIPPLDHF
jgi:hypothetical protein